MMCYYLNVHFQGQRVNHQNKVMRKLLGSERDEIAGDRQRLCNKEIHVRYSLPNVILVIK